jgi:protein-tyrosine phosphatase
MPNESSFVDIHCHLIPDIDDGAKSWDQTLTMARMAVADGIRTVVVTPHQLGTFAHNYGQLIRLRTAELSQFLESHQVPLQVLPGADVRIETGMVGLIRAGQVVTLADRGKHILLELPHELYFPLDDVLDELRRAGIVGILSHPERNQGLLKQPRIVGALVRSGCLMQVTCGSLLGTFGPGSLQMAEWMLQEGLVHFLATDAHGHTARRPLMRRAFERAGEIVGESRARDLCWTNPLAVAEGNEVALGPNKPRRAGFFSRLFKRQSAA